ncbi:cupin domain-containing protein [Rhodoligotrophos defluvii]|uniref:cupin domain-containing protein n=1 Tax=Rhodoligotrophos defluvii TaxID=2561934 RepID=UPI0010C99869|nr:cupin domain-containing protein [Rhodoligotrophos defluvii]
MAQEAQSRFTKGLVLHDDDGDSYWQPVPANGYVTVKLTPENWDGPFSVGIQVVAPHSYIRKHAHDRNLEVLFVWGGKGRAIVGDEEHPMRPGTLIMLPKNVEHKFINDGDEDLKLLWTMSPHGLEDFFRQIGRPRKAGEPAPANFPRPANVHEIERNTVFADPVED